MQDGASTRQTLRNAPPSQVPQALIELRPMNRFLWSGAAGIAAALAHARASSADRNAHPQAEPLAEPGAMPPAATEPVPTPSPTPVQVLSNLRQGHRRFKRGEPLARDHLQRVQATAPAQSPQASFVSCIDSRVPIEIIFDQGIGDLFSAKVAGNVINQDILGSLEFASKVVGSKLIVVLGHTRCGAVAGACDDVQLDNLTPLLKKIQPAIASVPSDATDRSSGNPGFVDAVAEQNVRLAIGQIRARSPILSEMERRGQIRVVGAMYNVGSGDVRWLDHEPTR